MQYCSLPSLGCGDCVSFFLFISFFSPGDQPVIFRLPSHWDFWMSGSSWVNHTIVYSLIQKFLTLTGVSFLIYPPMILHCLPCNLSWTKPPWNECGSIAGSPLYYLVNIVLGGGRSRWVVDGSSSSSRFPFYRFYQPLPHFTSLSYHRPLPHYRFWHYYWPSLTTDICVKGPL